MSVAVMLQALGWVSVVALVTVHVLIQHGRLPQNGMAYRIAGCAAASCVVAASAAERIWPVAVLGLLWLRIEVFGHRHHVPECLPGVAPAPALEPAPHPASSSTPEGMPPFLVGAMARTKQQPPTRSPGPKAGRPGGAGRGAVPQQQSHPHLPHPHLPHPHLDRRAVDRVFKIEMGIVIVIAVVLFGIWAEQQRESFRTTTDHVVCNWIEGC